jgi:hypothetical protein
MSKRNIAYDNTDELKNLLVGHRIVSVTKGTRAQIDPDDWNGSLEAFTYTLDNGVELIAAGTDGGCACSNGCFTLTEGALPDNAITNVEVAEDYSYGSQQVGAATIRMFVYSGDEKTELFSSSGGDNGYYGWGHAIYAQEVFA